MTSLKKIRAVGTDNSGMVLVAVLAVISLLLVAAVHLARKTGNSALASAHTADRIIAREKAMTGLHFAMALLAEDAAGSDIDSVQENWARPEKLAMAVNALGMGKESLILEIQDELGKLPVNALIKKYPGRELNPDSFQVWENFLEEFTQEPVVLLNAIQDWLDQRDDDAVTGISGAESDYYLSLDPPYTCANAPFTHLSELFLVKGISRELFDGNPDDEEAISVVPREVITVHGLDENEVGNGYYAFSVRVNINTATEPVLRSLLPRDKADLAKDLVSYRVEQTDDHEFIAPLDKGWVDQVINFSKEEKVKFDRLVRYSSHLFSVRSKAKENSAQTVLTAIIHRAKNKLTGKWSCRILQVTKED